MARTHFVALAQAICLYSSGYGYSGNHHMHYYDLNDDVLVPPADEHWFRLGALARNFTEGDTFALTFTSSNNERFTTIPIDLDGESKTPIETAGYIKAALEGLPNGVIDSVVVDVAYDDDGTSIVGSSSSTYLDEIDDFPCDVVAVITFDGNQVKRSPPHHLREKAILDPASLRITIRSHAKKGS